MVSKAVPLNVSEKYKRLSMIPFCVMCYKYINKKKKENEYKQPGTGKHHKNGMF